MEGFKYYSSTSNLLNTYFICNVMKFEVGSHSKRYLNSIFATISYVLQLFFIIVLTCYYRYTKKGEDSKYSKRKENDSH